MIKSIQDIKSHKNKEQPLVCLTAYTAPVAAAIAPHVDLILVGDSLGMVLYGLDSTREVTMEMMVDHGKAVVRRRGKTPVIVDMPFGTYEDNVEQALENARRIICEAHCDGVKLEGGEKMAEVIAYLVHNDIPVMGHIGLTPQAVDDGKFRVKGKTDEQIEQLLKDAKAVEAAGAFAVVIEGTIEPVAKQITGSISIPTIGIGASAACDGQILVTEDMLGLLDGHTPKFVKHYAQLRPEIEKAVEAYANDVRSRAFPKAEQLYTAPKNSENS